MAATELVASQGYVNWLQLKVVFYHVSVFESCAFKTVICNIKVFIIVHF